MSYHITWYTPRVVSGIVCCESNMTICNTHESDEQLNNPVSIKPIFYWVKCPKLFRAHSFKLTGCNGRIMCDV